jgi:hypothetical protein
MTKYAVWIQFDYDEGIKLYTFGILGRQVDRNIHNDTNIRRRKYSH